MKSNLTLVAIFPGPAPYFRVRELAPGSVQAQTVRWCCDYEEALRYVDKYYSQDEMCSPEDFCAEVKRRKGGKP